MKLLVIDDSKHMRVLLEDYLIDGGYKEVLSAASAEEAFKLLGINKGKLESLPIDIGCILLDIIMPGIDGIEACKRIKSFNCYKDVPIIVVTASEEPGHLQKAFDAGAIEYLRKPVNENELQARVRTMLKLKKEMDERKEKEEYLTALTDQLKESNVALEKLSFRDAVTGLSNRFHLERQLFREWRRAMRYKNWLSFILFEIDFYDKFIENNNENDAENTVRKISKQIYSTLHRPADLVARITESQFAILLPDTNFAGAASVAENVRLTIEIMKIRNSVMGANKYLTVSGGAYSVIPIKHLNPPLLIQKASMALNDAKTTGRNKIVALMNRKER